MQISEQEILATVARIGGVMSRILAERVLTFVAMFVASGLFAWAMYEPDYIRLATACAFAVLVFFRVAALEKKGANHGQATE